MLKDWPKVYRKLRRMRGLTTAEKVRWAMSLAATPNERWRMNIERCRALAVWGKGLAGKRKLERLVIAGKDWLPDMDLNHDKQIQSLLCYRYTIGQAGACKNVMLSP